MDFGYARVSTQDQNLDLQIGALKNEEIDTKNIYVDMVSGVRSDPPRFNRPLEKLRAGDTFFIWKLDRMARCLIPLVKVVDGL